MNITKDCEPYVIEELTVVLADTVRNRIDTLIGYNVPVLVEFNYDGGSKEDDEAPQIYHMEVKAQDSVLQGERCTLTLWNGYDITNYLTSGQEMRIEQAMLDRMSERAKEANDQARIDAAEQQRQERAWVWGQQ